jgi:hypothetical protein
MNIQVVYFEGCPNHAPTVALVKQVVAKLGMEVQVEEVEVASPEEAVSRRFLGSPTVLVNGSILIRRRGSAPTTASVAASTVACRASCLKTCSWPPSSHKGMRRRHRRPGRVG